MGTKPMVLPCDRTPLDHFLIASLSVMTCGSLVSIGFQEEEDEDWENLDRLLSNVRIKNSEKNSHRKEKNIFKNLASTDVTQFQVFLLGS